MKNLLLTKYKSISSPAKASFWFVFSNILVNGISFITLPIFSRLLTPEQYGVISVYNSWKSIISIFCTLTLWGGVFNIVLTKYSNEKDRYISAFQGLSTVITLLFVILTFLFIRPFEKFSTLNPLLTLCLYLEILCQTPFNLWASYQRYEYKYKLLVCLSILVAVLNPIIGYFSIIYTEYKVEARILSGAILNIFLGIVFFIINLKKGKCFYNNTVWKFAISFNIVLVPHYLSMQVLSQSDRIMISKLCNNADAGIYSIAYTFAMLLTLITNGINSSFTPFIYKKLKVSNYKEIKKTTNTLLLGLMVLTIAVICLIPDIFYFMLPKTYHSAVWVIPPIAASVFFMFLYPLFGSVEFYYEAKKYVTIASVFGAILNIVLNHIFIKMFGFIAAAYTTLFCYICFSIFHYFVMKIVLKKNGIYENIYDIKTMLLISILLIIFSIALTILYSYRLLRWIIILVLFLVIFISRKKIKVLIKSLK